MTITPLHDPYLADKVAANLFGFSVATFWRRVADGTIPRGVKIGGCRRWRLSDLEAVRKRLEAEAVS